MKVFSEPEYYPTPSEKVATFATGNAPSTPGVAKQAQQVRRLLRADIPALIVYLSSPIDAVDYSVFADFFLVYRAFLSPLQLHELLISRFRWAYIETIAREAPQTSIGEVALVRTFTLLRHSLLNWFLRDFTPDSELRALLLRFLNDDYSAMPTIVRQCVVNLKKVWVAQCKMAWDGVVFDQPATAAEWGAFVLRDVDDLARQQKRRSVLSWAAWQREASPTARNDSMLSLFNSGPQGSRPLQATKEPPRTGSMLLYPHDESNMHSVRGPAATQPVPGTPTQNGLNSDKNKRRTLVQRMSKVITDVDYPRSPEINRIIPPTPAKKLEFILDSMYIPEEQAQEDAKPAAVATTNETTTAAAHARASRGISRSSSLLYRGAVSLLAKWKRNHSRDGNITHMTPTKDVSQYEKPEMDRFVKYVISISSLDHENSDTSTQLPKFDILSARTIDEVEYLISLEHKLVDEVDAFTNSSDNQDANSKAVMNLEPRRANVYGNSNFTALDNLDLYQTVNTIARSVISLTNTLQRSNANTAVKAQDETQAEVQNTNTEFPYLSPSFDRRMVRSTTATTVSLSTSKKVVTLNNDTDVAQGTNGPQKLVFHESQTVTYDAISVVTSQQHGSPLKRQLPDSSENIIQSSDVDSVRRAESPASSVTYDSDLSATSPGLSNGLSEKSQESTPGPVREIIAPLPSQGLSKKVSSENLREFTFEDQDKPEPSKTPEIPEDAVSVSLSLSDENDDDEMSDDIQPLEATTLKLGTPSSFASPLERTKKMMVRPASGRISIMKRRTIQTTPLGRGSIGKSPLRRPNTFLKDQDFISKDNILFENELQMSKLEERNRRESFTPSVSTSKLFNSVHNSPMKSGSPKKITIDDGGRIRLSIAPSMNSIQSGSSLSSSLSIRSPLKDKRVNNLRDEFQKGDISGMSDIEAEAGNKYVFSPDNDSFNAASPEKDLEQLKNKFLQSNNNSEHISQSSDLGSTPRRESISSTSKNANDDLNPTNLKDIADMPDDSMHDDPVNVAMTKLEGTYTKGADQIKMQSSPDVSNVGKDVGLLSLEQVASIPRTPGEKRRSLLIERRRKTIMTIPFTPQTQQSTTADSDSILDKAAMEKIQELMGSYEIEDQNLQISNNQHHIPFILMYDSQSVAEQMTLIEKELLKEIDWKDMLDLNIEYQGPNVTSWLQLLIGNENLSGIDLMVARFNLMVTWIISEISLTQDVKMRRNTIQRFIHVAEHCLKFQNFNTLMEIVLALSSTTVQKMIDAWRLIEPGDLLTWEELKNVSNLNNNYSSIRQLLSEVDPLVGCIPFIAIYLSDLAINSEKKTWIEEDKIVNYNKFDMNVQIVKHFIQLSQWSKFYAFKPEHELLSKCVYITALTDDEITQLNSGMQL
ncbi:mitotic regulator [Maudiozyma humilis]|uniref:Guanine nucleotide exchange factor LTE1 n=1 Tax=Maudiozyma humilis TaxID=51915 RepID=A0AAV5RWP0_MAUHU|nr:mitotic regulator [Kazachstania humilis]